MYILISKNRISL